MDESADAKKKRNQIEEVPQARSLTYSHLTLPFLFYCEVSGGGGGGGADGV